MIDINPAQNEPEDMDVTAWLPDEKPEDSLPKPGEMRQGRIARISPTEILIEIGTKSEGVLSEQELASLPQAQRDALQVGAIVTVEVLGESEDDDGRILVSMARVREVRHWGHLDELFDKQLAITGEIVHFNKGGLIVSAPEFAGQRAFLPSSQVGLERHQRAVGSTPAERWGSMTGETVVVKILEKPDAERNRLIVSERSASKEARAVRRKQAMDAIAPGQVHTGRVVSISSFGAFVDIGGADGLVHLSELSWRHIDHPKEVVRVGQQLQVKVLSVDFERQRIALSSRVIEQNPWEAFASKFQDGQLVRATITRLTKFGAFATISAAPEIEGLVHVSELANNTVEHAREVVSQGEELTLRILKIELEQQRVRLSLREVASANYAEQDYAFYMAATDAQGAAPETASPENSAGEPGMPQDAALDEGASGPAASDSSAADGN